ncbi:MAG: dihydroneopterin triphosphate diphosphatase [Gallionella sp.]
MKQYKQPVSVLVVIYTTELEVLLLERADHPDYWQSVTGSCEPDETFCDTAVREVKEETGLDTRLFELLDWQLQNEYEIYPHWRHRYAPGVTRNIEHVFGLQLPDVLAIKLETLEHLNCQWLPYREAAKKVFSPSNCEAILRLGKAENNDKETIR